MDGLVAALQAATPLVTAIGVLVIGVFTAINNFKATKRAAQIDAIEKNTNSLTAALVKTTGEAEHAKGIVQGRTEATAAVALAGVLEAARPSENKI